MTNPIDDTRRTPTPRPASRLLAFALGLLALLTAGTGCQRAQPPPPPAKSAKSAPAPASTDYDLTGVVRAVDTKASTVRVRHEAIPGFMAAMTMDFAIANPNELANLRPGDEIQATLRVVREGGEVKDYALVDIAVTGGSRLTLDPGGAGGPTLSAGPKRLKPGDEVPDFTMTTQEGRPLKLSDLRGKVVAMTFIYTRCPMPDFCPLLDKKFSELAALVEANPKRVEAVRLLSVSFDPEHDTPEVLALHAKTRGARPPLWTFAVASHAELAKVAGPLGLMYGPRPDEIIHNRIAVVIGPDGRLVTSEADKSWTPANLFKSMYSQIPASRG